MLYIDATPPRIGDLRFQCYIKITANSTSTITLKCDLKYSTQELRKLVNTLIRIEHT